MNWATALWAMLIGGCVSLALPYLVVGIWQRRAAHLFFVLATLAVVGIAAAELFMMWATSVDDFLRLLRWGQVPIFVLVVALVGFVWSYFGTGRPWLGITVVVVRFTCLVLNFVVRPALNFERIDRLGHLRFLGETVSVPV